MSRVAVVTGGTRGIGEAISVALKKAGYKVAANYAGNDERAKAFADKHGIAVFKWDVADFDSCIKGAAEVVAKLGPIDVLVNNAGITRDATLKKQSRSQWDEVLDTNLGGCFNMCKAVWDGMLDRSFGRIVNIGSIHSLVASPYKSAYVAAKHGLLGFSKVVALETAGTDITINTICPTYVKTPLVDRQIADQARTRGIPEAQVVSEVMLKPMPKGVFITFEELAGIAAFLMSPAARNITGHSIDVDGGWTVQ